MPVTAPSLRFDSSTKDKPQLIEEDRRTWSLALRGQAVSFGAATEDEHYRQVYKDAQSRLLHGFLIGDAESFAAYMKEWRSGDGSALAGGDLFQPLDLSLLSPSDRSRVQKEVQAIKRNAPRTPADRDQYDVVAGVTTRPVQQFAAGTLLIQGRGATVTQYLVAHLRFEATSRSIVELDAEQLAGKDAAAHQRRVVGTEAAVHPVIRDSTDTVFKTLEALCGALSYIPDVGPAAAILGKGFTLAQLIYSGTKPDQFKEMLTAMADIIKHELTESKIQTQLSNLKTFGDSFNEHNYVLLSAHDQEEYITSKFLPFLEDQISTHSGSLDNAVHQLGDVYNDTHWTKIGIIEQALKGLCLGIGYLMLAHRTKVVLCGQLSLLTGDLMQKLKYTQQMFDALTDYEYAVQKSDVSPLVLGEWMEAYHLQRFDRSSVYWTEYGPDLAKTYYVKDKLDDDKTLDKNTYYIIDNGPDWAKRVTEEKYDQITEAATQQVMPIANKALRMITGFHQLNQKTSDLKILQYNTAVNWVDGKVYFFNKSKYLYSAMSMVTEMISADSPLAITSGWPGWPESFKEVDAGVVWLNSESPTAFFFKDSSYLSYDIPNNRVKQGPLSISGNWANWPSNFWPIDGVFTAPIDFSTIGTRKVYFIKGDQYISYDVLKDRADDGYPKPISSLIIGWPSSFTSVDYIISWSLDVHYAFQGDQYIRIRGFRVDQGPISTSAYWPALTWCCEPLE